MFGVEGLGFTVVLDKFHLLGDRNLPFRGFRVSELGFRFRD